MTSSTRVDLAHTSDDSKHYILSNEAYVLAFAS